MNLNKLRDIAERARPGKREWTWAHPGYLLHADEIFCIADGIQSDHDCNVSICDYERDFIAAMDRETVLLMLDVVEAATKHVDFAKEKGDCGPCLEWCPNAVDGDANCECGGSRLFCYTKALTKHLEGK